MFLLWDLQILEGWGTALVEVVTVPVTLAPEKTMVGQFRGGSRVLQLLLMQQSEFADEIVIKLKF